MNIKQKLFGDLDFNQIERFNEAEVRAVVIDPILKGLGFTADSIVREKHFEKYSRGSKKQKEILIPDYLLKVGESYAWALEAKASDKNPADYVQQAYDYAVLMEIRCKYFAICNGLEFLCFRTDDPKAPLISFRMKDIDDNWEDLQKTLSPESFHSGKTFAYEVKNELDKTREFNYLKRPLLDEIPAKKRAVKRHFGVHGYFTRQSWDIVNTYIQNFSQPGDVVLDPFGGSGVTAVEALVMNRKAINIDINPMAVFMVSSLLAPIDFNKFSESYHKVRAEYVKNCPKTKKDVARILKEYPGPLNLTLPKSSDVETVKELFSDEQTAQLSLLKAIIKKEKDKNIRNTLLLMFSGMVTKINLTYHTATAQRGNNIVSGDASAFRYYRYRLAPKPCYPDMLKYLDIRFNRILAAKKELEMVCSCNKKNFEQMTADAQIIKGSATDLSFIPNESVDYIYTDPPYGKKIPYLDLSVMWNAWLGFKVSEADYAQEAIEGGEHNKSKEEYNTLIARSIQEMYRVLKFDRWLSFVFAHKDPEFWHLIIETCEKCGFEYAGAVPQKNGQTSFKKRQNPFTVLSGQLIINFKKIRNPRTVLKANLGMDIGDIVIQTIEGIIAKQDGATLEQINDEIIIKGLELGFLDLLKKHYVDLEEILKEHFEKDMATKKYSIKKDSKFVSLVDVRLRIRYYLLSYLRRMERENKRPSFNDIVFAIMPLLKNGITPEEQTILGVLEDVAERVDADSWRLKKEEPTLHLTVDGRPI